MTDSETQAARETLKALIAMGPEDVEPGGRLPSKMLGRRLLAQLNGEVPVRSPKILQSSISRYVSGHTAEALARNGS